MFLWQPTSRRSRSLKRTNSRRATRRTRQTTTRDHSATSTPGTLTCLASGSSVPMSGPGVAATPTREEGPKWKAGRRVAYLCRCTAGILPISRSRAALPRLGRAVPGKVLRLCRSVSRPSRVPCATIDDSRSVPHPSA